MTPIRTIGIISKGFASYYHNALFQKMLELAPSRGYRLLIIATTPEEVAADRVAFDHVDGWLVINTTEGIEAIKRTEKPILLIGGTHPDVPYITPDNRSGTADAVSHLIATGRTRIAIVTYSINPDFRERYDAYCTTLAEYGIGLDPELVLDTQTYSLLLTYQFVRQKLAAGLCFDAVFCTNDRLAIGTMQAIQEAGLRVPEDVAIVGFDDNIEASLAVPPLSSVQQNMRELGRVAFELLLDQIERGLVPPQHTHIPTTLIIRQSSQEEQYVTAAIPHAASLSIRDWQAQLARDLVQLAIAPVTLAPEMSAEQIWPGVEALVADLAAILEGQILPSPPSYQLWAALHQLSGGGETLFQIAELLRSTAMQRVDCSRWDIMERLTRWLMVCQRAILQRQLIANTKQADDDREVFSQEGWLIEQIGRMDVDPQQLTWITSTHMRWAMMGLWIGRDPNATEPKLDICSIYLRDSGAAASHVPVSPAQFPPLELLPEGERNTLSSMIKILPLKSPDRRWGYLVYAEKPVWTFSDITHRRNAYIAAALERQELMASLQERQQTLQEAFERERTLADTIRELGCPTIPLLQNVLLVPLVGAIDSTRAGQIIERVLEAVAHGQISRVLLDITGVSLVDTHVAAALIQMAQAVGLLGAKVTLVGVRPEIAQSIVGLGVDLGMFETRSVLSSALADLLRQD